MKICVSVIVLVFMHLVALCQNDDISILLKRCKVAPVTERKESSGISRRPLMFPFKILFTFYRTSVSEQLSADCAFDLTCSRFSANAITRFGIIKGMFLSFDRLTRCHALVAHETVPVLFNNKTGKMIDEPSMY